MTSSWGRKMRLNAVESSRVRVLTNRCPETFPDRVGMSARHEAAKKCGLDCEKWARYSRVTFRRTAHSYSWRGGAAQSASRHFFSLRENKSDATKAMAMFPGKKFRRRSGACRYFLGETCQSGHVCMRSNHENHVRPDALLSTWSRGLC